MFPKNILLKEDERKVDPQLGFPRGYAKLCRNAHSQTRGLISPYTEGPPQRFLPYSPTAQELAMSKELNDLFPVTDAEYRDPTQARKYAELLWRQLDHLGNAGFDPDKFRIDPYGNVLYKYADPSSTLAWEIDHWFPHSRGGRTVPSNLRIVQYQVNQRKQNKLEFLVPWWDLQLGVSVNQFLSIFTSKNSDFRKRAFSFLFDRVEDDIVKEALLADSHCWPHHFRERRGEVGLAPAAIVTVQKTPEELLKTSNDRQLVNQHWPQVAASPLRKRWTAEEEEALRRGVQIFGPGNWKEIKEHEPLLQNRSTVQIKDKYRQIKSDFENEKENKNNELMHKEFHLSRAVQKEHRLQKLREQEIQLKKEEIFELEKQLEELQQHNESQLLAIEDLERALIKQRRRVEKHRRWSEAQLSYKSCLEKMIRDAMHQSVIYKEQGRLNQAACTTLMATLEAHKATCDASEMDLIKKLKQREDLESLLHPYLEEVKKKLHNDESNCSQKIQGLEQESRYPPPCHAPDLVATNVNAPIQMAEPNAIAVVQDNSFSRQNQCGMQFPKAHNDKEFPISDPNIAKSSKKEMPLATEGSELDVLIVGYENEGPKQKPREAESVGENLPIGTVSEFVSANQESWAKGDCGSRIGELHNTMKKDTGSKPLGSTELDRTTEAKQRLVETVTASNEAEKDETTSDPKKRIPAAVNSVSLPTNPDIENMIEQTKKLMIRKSHQENPVVTSEVIEKKHLEKYFGELTEDMTSPVLLSKNETGNHTVENTRTQDEKPDKKYDGEQEAAGPLAPNTRNPDSPIKLRDKETEVVAEAALRLDFKPTSNEPRLKRSQSGRVQAINSLLGFRKTPEASYRTEEEDHQLGMNVIKNGLTASIKTCTSMWRRALKKQDH